jgi:hypothetical protein
MKGNETERMKSRHLEEKQTFGRQYRVLQCRRKKQLT